MIAFEFVAPGFSPASPAGLTCDVSDSTGAATSPEMVDWYAVPAPPCVPEGSVEARIPRSRFCLLNRPPRRITMGQEGAT